MAILGQVRQVTNPFELTLYIEASEGRVNGIFFDPEYYDLSKPIGLRGTYSRGLDLNSREVHTTFNPNTEEQPILIKDEYFALGSIAVLTKRSLEHL